MKTAPWNTLIVCTSVLVGLYLFLPRQTGIPVTPDVPTPVVSELQDLKIVLANADKAAVYRLGALYCAIADQLERSPSVSTSDLRSWLVDADTHFIKGTDLQGAVPGFGAAKDKLFEKEIGLEVRDLSESDLKSLADLCHKISDACGYHK